MEFATVSKSDIKQSNRRGRPPTHDWDAILTIDGQDDDGEDQYKVLLQAEHFPNATVESFSSQARTQASKRGRKFHASTLYSDDETVEVPVTDDDGNEVTDDEGNTVTEARPKPIGLALHVYEPAPEPVEA